MSFRFRLRSFLIFLALLLVEIFIALFVKDKIIRPYVGDVLVVVLIYYFCYAFMGTDRHKLLLAVLLFSFAVEVGQYFNLVQHLGLQHNRFWTIVIGSSFHWLDLVAYTTGALVVAVLEFSGAKKDGR